MVMAPITRLRLAPAASILVAAALVIGCSKGQGSSHARDSFLHCRHMVNSGQYPEAVTCLHSHASEFPNSKFASRAGLFLGKAHVAQGHFDEARQAWQSVLDRYPSSLEGHKVRYKLAVLLMLEGKRSEALAAFQAMADTPDGPLAAEASAMVRNLIPLEQ